MSEGGRLPALAARTIAQLWAARGAYNPFNPMRLRRDIILAFSTAPIDVFARNVQPEGDANTISAVFLREPPLDNIFEATVQATEEAIINALVAGETMVGVHGNRVYAIPHDRLRQVLRRHDRLKK